MVARSVRDAEVVGSNPVASTKTRIRAHLAPFFHVVDWCIYARVSVLLVFAFERLQFAAFCSLWAVFYFLNLNGYVKHFSQRIRKVFRYVMVTR